MDIFCIVEHKANQNPLLLCVLCPTHPASVRALLHIQVKIRVCECEKLYGCTSVSISDFKQRAWLNTDADESMTSFVFFLLTRLSVQNNQVVASYFWLVMTVVFTSQNDKP